MIVFIFAFLSILSVNTMVSGSNAAYSFNDLNGNYVDTISKPHKDPKLDYYLTSICRKENPSPSEDISLINDGTNTLLIDIYLKEGCTKIEDLYPLIEDIRASREGVIEAKIYKNRLISIRDLPYVSYISLPRRHYRDGIEVISEAANCTSDLMGICTYRNQGFDGDGIVVAVLDSEFYRDFSINRELPEKLVITSGSAYTPAERHGTACAELVKDVAPNVTMYLIDIGETEQDFIIAMENIMKLGQKIDVISCSLDFRLGLFNEEDDVNKAVRNVTSSGTIWVNSAGNFAERHWSGTFKDRDLDNYCDFAENDESINLSAKRGELVRIWLNWDEDWHRAQYDYDLYLYAPDNTYSSSNNPQQGYFGHKPAEFISMIAPTDGIYQIAIKKYKADNDITSFQLFSSHRLNEYNVQNGSLGIISCSEDVITTGAVDIFTLKIENSSSRGPTRNGKLKPDLVAPDNVSTMSYWPERFIGTSSSAPYIAGCTALVLEKYGSASFSEIKAALMASCIDLGPKGPDYAYGYGLVNVDSIKEPYGGI
ncbi:MAG: S8 family serine peptidase [Methanotrichaceae archaeon]|nr:S8 family serine peptidase [Methanotrichaceae archaeon]